MTPEQARAAAVVAVRSSQGLTGKAPSSWTYEQRIAYNKALAAYILAYPLGFTPSDAGTAAQISAKNYEPLSDASFDWGAFADETVSNAGKTAEGFKFSLGTGVVLGIVALAVLAFFRFAPARRA